MTQNNTGEINSNEEILTKAKKAENIGNIDEAMNLYLTLAENGDAVGQYKYANLKESLWYENNENPSSNEINQLFNLYKQSAEQGYDPAQCKLGYIYDERFEDKSRAFYWFEKAAEQGNYVAQYNVGYFYEYGISIPKDDEKAFNWYRESAEQGYDAAQWALGIFYDEGKVVPEDKNEALILFEKSAEHGFSPAQWSLGNYYLEGKVVPIDINKAIDWYEKSARQEFVSAQYDLCKIYIESDEEKAFFWLKKLSDNYIREDSNGDELCEVANMYNYLLTPKEWRNEIKKTRKTGKMQTFAGLGLVLFGCFVSLPLAIGGTILHTWGSFNIGKANGSTQRYKEILESERGHEMINIYREAERRNSAEAHEYLKSLDVFFKQFKGNKAKMNSTR